MDKLKFALNNRDNRQKKKPASKPATQSAPKSASKSSKATKVAGKSKNQRSFILTDDALAIVTKIRKKQHGMTQSVFVSKAVCEFGKQVLGDDFPALRESQVEYVAERLNYLEKIVIGEKWQELADETPKLAERLVAMVEELQLEPHAIDKKRANAWRKKHGGVQSKKITQGKATLAAYARKLGLIEQEEDEE